MNIFEHNGKVLLQQHEGNRQLASALADGAHVLLRRLATFFAKALRRIPGGCCTITGRNKFAQHVGQFPLNRHYMLCGAQPENHLATGSQAPTLSDRETPPQPVRLIFRTALRNTFN